MYSKLQTYKDWQACMRTKTFSKCRDKYKLYMQQISSDAKTKTL
jgi:hypothetical protein